MGASGDVLERLTHRLGHSEGTALSSRADWAELVAASQGVVNTATALQNLAITRLAAIEDDLLDDGSLVESPRAPGHIALDAPDVVAGALGVSHNHAEQRVSLAVRLTVPDDEQAGVGAGLGGLHAAMAHGVLDGYRASVVADELAEAPPEVAAAVVHVLVPYLGSEPPAALRNRCRRALARISPDLLVQRASRARERCGLRRWVEEPGVDRWEGTFPSERAAEGWAAVDGLAQRYVAEGRCATVEAARGEALMDLIRGQATVDVQLVVTVPAQVVTASPSAAPDDEPPESLEPGAGGSSAVDEPGPADGVSARASLGERVSGPAGGASAASRVSAPRGDAVPVSRESDLVEVTGPFPGGPVLVARRWVMSLRQAAERPPTDPAVQPLVDARVELRAELCHPDTGALLGARGSGGRGYRPGARVAAVVRARDGRCRFPGCSVAARFCDLDHVRPWPRGVTAPANLMCLCRRHHRIKQRPTWAVRLLPDGRAVWTDPIGRVRTSWPRDLLTPVVLSGPAPSTLPSEGPAAPAGEGSAVDAGEGSAVDAGEGSALHADVGSAVVAREGSCSTTPATWSFWETLLEVRVEHLPASPQGAAQESCRSGRATSAPARRAGPCWWWPSRGAFRYVDDRRGHLGRPVRAPRRSPTPSAADLAPPPF